MAALLQVPHGFFRRNLSKVERVLVAGGLSAALYALMAALPTYPAPWEAVITTAVFFVLLWSPPVAYFLAIIAAVYPLYSVSVYVAVLFLAVALLGQRLFIQNLGGTLLVLTAPWLAQAHLEWLAPLLGGLWWGRRGAWIGALAALWGQLFFGMTGQHADWVANMGLAPQVSRLLERFGDANSLQTLRLLIEPLAPNPTVLLYHLLQVVLWGMTAGLIGAVCEQTWTQQKHPWRAVAVTLGGAAGLLAGHFALARWLAQDPAGAVYSTADFAWIVPGLWESALYSALLAVGLEIVRDFVEHPLLVGRVAHRGEAKLARDQRAINARLVDVEEERQSEGKFAGILGNALQSLRGMPQREEKPEAKVQPAQAAALQQEKKGEYTPLPVPENLPRRDPKKQRPDDIIKIELD